MKLQFSTIAGTPPARFVNRHREKFWWFHSFYALLFGLGFMWLGARHFTYLRVAVFHIAFIWLSSLALPTIASHARLQPPWPERLRLFVNYLQRNFYQQLLFFILPIYARSATCGAANSLFVVLVAAAAVLSTLDVVYDRHLTRLWWWLTLFFSFNLFACINVMLPILWGMPLKRASAISAALALVGFATFLLRFSPLSRCRQLALIGLGAALLAGLVGWGRSAIPPAPLRLLRAEFALGFDTATRRIVSPLTALEPGFSGRVHFLSAVRAPLGLRDRIRHVWFLNGERRFASRFFTLSGGRRQGFRLWTSLQLDALTQPATLRVCVETEAGQLVGWGRLSSSPPAF